MARSSRKTAFEALQCYNDVLSCPFGIHTSLTDGIPSYRIVYLNTQAKDVNESITDNGTVGYAATADATAQVAGVVKYGCDFTDFVSDHDLVTSNKDINVTVTLLGTMIVEVEPAAVIPVGADLGANATGQATAAGGTGLIAMSPSTGVGTVDNPEFVIALIR